MPRIVDGVHLNVGARIDRQNHALLQRAIVVELVFTAENVQLQMNEGDAVGAFLEHQPAYGPSHLAFGHTRRDVAVEQSLSRPPSDVGSLLHIGYLLSRLDDAQFDEGIRRIHELCIGHGRHQLQIGADRDAHPLLLS